MYLQDFDRFGIRLVCFGYYHVTLKIIIGNTSKWLIFTNHHMND